VQAWCGQISAQEQGKAICACPAALLRKQDPAPTPPGRPQHCGLIRSFEVSRVPGVGVQQVLGHCGARRAVQPALCPAEAEAEPHQPNLPANTNTHKANWFRACMS